MKNKILFRLITYFTVTLLVFSLVIGIIFSTFFSRHNMEIHRTELEKIAVNVADTLSGMLEDTASTQVQVRRGSGYGAFRRFIEDISMNEVWVVHRDLTPIICISDYECNREYPELWRGLPDWATEIVWRAIYEEAMISESHTAFLQAPLIITAIPIVMYDGRAVGAALLRSHHVSDIYEITRSGIIILIFSMATAVLISVFIAAILSSRFTKPLSKMKDTALQISSGNYTVKTGIIQPDEIGELASVIDDMASKLETSSQEQMKFDKLRRDFIANISHELRTPVTVIRGSLEAICDGVVSNVDKIDEYHTQMLSESIYLERLVSDLLDLARLQNPDFSMECNDVDLKEIMEDVIRSMRRIAESKDIKLDFVCNGQNFLIVGDYGRLRQMIIIIIDNAIKFSPAGKIVNIVLSETETGVDVTICDEGCGIHADEFPFIFERFYKHRSEENKAGTGLGLAIAKQIAERHGISIEATSVEGQGAEFSFKFCNENNNQ